MKSTPHEIPFPLINQTNERKKKIFCLEKSCATKHPYQNNQGLFWYTDDLIENTGLRYDTKKSNESENRQMALTCQLYKSGRTKTR